MPRQRRKPTPKETVEAKAEETGASTSTSTSTSASGATPIAQPGKRTNSKTNADMADVNGLHLGGGRGGFWTLRAQWIFFAIASGACAAFNGVFAKLTTTELTTTLSNKIADLFGLSAAEKGVEVVVRGTFFVLNLVFNGIMWTLFTTALARGTSTTQVSIINTSTNFVLTALLGLAVFSESLPPIWWAGAALLVAGNVIVGRKDEAQDAGGSAAAVGADSGVQGAGGYEPVMGGDDDDVDGRRKASGEGEDEDVIDLGDISSDRGR